MQLKQLILPGLVVGGLLYYSAVNKFKDNYQLLIKRFHFNSKETNSRTWLKLCFDLDLELVNPSDLAGKLTGINLQLIYNGRELGRITKNDLVTIAPNATVMLPRLVSIPTLTLFKNVTNAITAFASGEKIMIQVLGKISTNLGDININEVRNVL
jgi:hypothetical protein